MPTWVQMCCGDCGIEFCVPDFFQKERQETGKGWHCPNGHPRVYRETDVDKMRRERDLAKQQLARAEQETAAAKRRAEKLVKEKKRLEKRAAAGTCPRCQRTFSNMSTHMRKQHPTFVAQVVEAPKLKVVK